MTHKKNLKGILGQMFSHTSPRECTSESWKYDEEKEDGGVAE